MNSHEERPKGVTEDQTHISFNLVNSDKERFHGWAGLCCTGLAPALNDCGLKRGLGYACHDRGLRMGRVEAGCF